MTIRNNWCTECEDTCTDHPSICTICGSPLQAPPVPPPRSSAVAAARANRNNNIRRPSGVPVVPDTLVAETRQASRELFDRLRSVRAATAQMDGDNMTMLQAALAGGNNINTMADQQWQTAPAEWMDPSNSNSSSSRPTSAKYLAQIPRTILTANSALFRQGSLTGNIVTSSANTTTTASTTSTQTTNEDEERELKINMEVIPADFGPTQNDKNAIHLQDCVLIVPRTDPTCRRGNLDAGTRRAITAAAASNTGNTTTSNKTKMLVYLQRGDGVTFCRKALYAQAAGAHAVVIGNNTSEPWPYIMKDSNGEAKNSLTIPVVMIKLSDAQALVKCVHDDDSNNDNADDKNAASIIRMRWNLEVGSSDSGNGKKECAVCADEFATGQTLLRLPSCGHWFHEACALQWLKSHNTCPYCRRELPTDDEAYEQERRRTERTHAAVDGSSQRSMQQYSDFYN